MPLPSLHPLPNNPTTGQAPLANLRSGPPPASAAGGGGVPRETLKGLQDVYWSDDEDDPDCLLCAEPLDLSDLNFKPCQCGMQICQFCYNKLLTSDSRCPGCRRPYDAKAVVFQPVDWEEVKRAKEKKTKRAKTIKQLNSMGRRHLLGVRVVMKNMVYVTGMKIPGSGDEAISTLRSNDYFGQYGKISKLYLRDRNPSTSVSSLNDDSAPGIYVVYVRREDAARAILALDGIPAPQGPAGQVLRACFGTTRYCDAFLKGQKCDIHGCTALHEWGGDSDCFTKDDFETAMIRPAEYDARQKQAQIAAPPISQKSDWPKPSSIVVDSAGSSLPSSAAWGKGIPVARPTARAAVPIGTSRPVKPPTSISTALPLKSNVAFPLPTPSPVQPTPVKEKKEKKERGPAMARGKSTDSIPSSTTNSAQVSPRKKPITLPAIAPITPAKPPPPPGLSVVTSTPTPASASATAPAPAPAVSPAQAPTAITVETPDELVDEPQSSESEAGPSTSSPTPQTPTRSDHPPPPLTDEPIFIHSPYEEPRLYPFPLSDPEFEFHLGLDALELLRDDGSRAYQPSPFNKTLVGLAQMGILAPELPDLLNYQHRESFSGSFQPFDALDEDGSNEAGPSSGVLRTPAKKPSAAIQEEEDWEIEGPRTISRFDFARPSSRSTSGRGQSPFALTRNMRDERAAQMSQQQQHAQHQTPGHGQGQGQSGLENALAAGFGGFGGLGGSSAQGLLSGYGASNEWGNGGHGNAGHESPFGARETGRYKRDREEYDQGMHFQQQQQNMQSSRLFSPDPPSHSNLDEFHSPAHPSSSAPPGFFNAQHPSHASPVYDPRNQYHQRPQSPTPLSQGFRRF